MSMSRCDQSKAMMVSVSVSSGMSESGPGLGSTAFRSSAAKPVKRNINKFEGVYEDDDDLEPPSPRRVSYDLGTKVANRLELQAVSSYVE